MNKQNRWIACVLIFILGCKNEIKESSFLYVIHTKAEFIIDSKGDTISVIPPPPPPGLHTYSLYNFILSKHSEVYFFTHEKIYDVESAGCYGDTTPIINLKTEQLRKISLNSLPMFIDSLYRIKPSPENFTISSAVDTIRNPCFTIISNKLIKHYRIRLWSNEEKSIIETMK